MRKRQLRTLEFIDSYTAIRGWPPTLREVARETGVTVGTARADVIALEDAGHVRRGRGARAVKVLNAEVQS